ncbi:CutA1 divalent ion tolerance domain-containing protein, putative [Eimeria necatrix]|uniref:CutA1 divalent ion tolerance domain-containing protein, putative n=1 Tax=Eimeria necatrix TaxID=51315 RepID=U6MR95_9EIME|nr:CutA1 divalent ion tolerance domain-containing protein, putative [Eimeria necatrix]CDJ64175.1 CutA1 divalent ion tolerance domain-containing protein, putative [Eimeria necatrix]
MVGTPFLVSTLVFLLTQYVTNFLSSGAIHMENQGAQRIAMASTEGLVVGFSTASSSEEARSIAENLIVKNLAACVQIVPAVESVYEWKGELVKSAEVLMIIKAQRQHAQAVVQAIKEKHSYEVPEVVFTEIVDGNTDYLQWARAATQPRGS